MKAGTEKQPGMIVVYGDSGTAWAIACFFFIHTTPPARGGTLAQVYVPARRCMSFHNDQLWYSQKRTQVKNALTLAAPKEPFPGPRDRTEKWGH